MSKIGDATLYTGDVLDVLRTITDESVNCCVTSPPYWGLRDYGVAGQIGLEQTSAEYLAKMVAVFEEVRRVLRQDGTCWVNLGDCYASSGGAGWQGKHGQRSNRTHTQRTLKNKVGGGIKQKDLVGIPWAVAFALRDAGWWLRQDIIWSKPNPMPESAQDRFTTSHEHVFLLTKRPRYYFNMEAVLEDISESTHMRISQNVVAQVGSYRANGGNKTNGPMKALVTKLERKMGRREDGVKHNASFEANMSMPVLKRKRRSVWEIAPKAFKEAHFATFPEKLVEPCILAGCPPGGVVLDPFLGSGTTGAVALRLGRAFIGIELNSEYMTMAERRIRSAWNNRPALFPPEELEPEPKKLFEGDHDA